MCFELIYFGGPQQQQNNYILGGNRWREKVDLLPVVVVFTCLFCFLYCDVFCICVDTEFLFVCLRGDV